LVQHIAVWEDVGRRRLTGDRAQIAISSPEDWPPPEDTSEAAWELAKAALDSRDIRRWLRQSQARRNRV
jgi:hypothetical protein